nr:disease resistance protein RPM1-like [Ziziphus jujuba var. spinosa]
MAECAVTTVSEKLIDLLVHKTQLFRRVHREAKALIDELEIIQCFLKDAEARLEKGGMIDGVKTWVKQVIEIAYNIEDVIDEYLLHMAQSYQGQSGYLGVLSKTGNLLKALKPRLDIASEIQNVMASLGEIRKRSERYGFKSLEQRSNSQIPNAEQHDPRLDSFFIEETELVGFDTIRNELVRKLVEGKSTRMVVSLVGSGGIGKTTLAKKVYDNEAVREHFECHAWITVSQSYDMEKILRTMTKKICAVAECPLREMDSMQELINHLRQYLQTKRYVFVFDDVWQIDFWKVMKHALPSNDKGSRIIITTRNDIIAASFKENSCDFVQKLLPLSQELGWELFCKKAFRYEFEGRCPQELEHLSLEIVKRCQGLPLVVAAIGGLLSTKEKVMFEWLRMLESLTYELENNPQLTSILRILSLSYHDLPHHLKSCFLYFGLFPEDYSITDVKLFKLWIAEGFVKEKKGKTMEQVAEEYLIELVHRNLVEASWETVNKSNRLCRVHDLMHEIIKLKAGELGFCQILNDKDSRCRGKIRRLSIYNCNKNVLDAIEDHGVRSIFFFNIENLPKSFVAGLFKKFKLLKVLDFSYAPLDHLPKEVGNLFHLKYLNLRNTQVKKLPKSVGKLQNLQTLDLRGTLVHKLPFQINKLQNLRHLLAVYFDEKVEFSSNSVRGIRIQWGIGSLDGLQTLTTLEAPHHGVDLMKELGNLKQLRRLGISNLTTENGRELCSSIEKMNHLEHLDVFAASKDETLDLQSISSPPPFLQHLVLTGLLKKLPEWFPKLENIQQLCLSFSRLHEDPLKCLKGLPNLVNLWLYQAYDGEQLHFEEGGFGKLKVLSLGKMYTLKVLKIDQGALPLLEELGIGPSPLLKEVPSDIQNLKNLKLLKIYQMPRKFVLDMQPGTEGRDYWKVKHIHSVHFWYRVEGDVYDIYKLGDPHLLEHLQS